MWFSTQLDLSAKRALLRVGRRLKKEVVSGWAGNSLKISDGLQVSDAEVSSEGNKAIAIYRAGQKSGP